MVRSAQHPCYSIVIFHADLCVQCFLPGILQNTRNSRAGASCQFTRNCQGYNPCWRSPCEHLAEPYHGLRYSDSAILIAPGVPRASPFTPRRASPSHPRLHGDRTSNLFSISIISLLEEYSLSRIAGLAFSFSIILCRFSQAVVAEPLPSYFSTARGMDVSPHSRLSTRPSRTSGRLRFWLLWNGLL